MNKRLPVILLALSIFLCAFPTWLAASDADFRQGMKAREANNFAEALHYMELAVSGDPDNILYASEYRQTAIRSKDFDRTLQFFEKELAKHPSSSNLHLNYGFAYVDKIPAAGAITQVILADRALNEFSKAIELQGSWIGYYTRGESYLFWPKIFNRAPMGVADLEKAMEIQKKGPRRKYHVKVFVALGDGYWKTDQLEKARTIWQAGLKEFPDSTDLKERLARQGDALKDLIEAGFDPARRVNTDLRDLWEN